MKESVKGNFGESSDKEIIYSKAIKAGKRIYYLDVKKNLKDEMFLAITESKKIEAKAGQQVSFEKHKIFLYKEDFDKFQNGLEEVIGYIKKSNAGEIPEEVSIDTESASEEIKLKIEF